MTILTDLLVGLGVDVGCRDQDAKLAVSQPGDEATGSSLSGSPRGDAVAALLLLHAPLSRVRYYAKSS